MPGPHITASDRQGLVLAGVLGLALAGRDRPAKSGHDELLSAEASQVPSGARANTSTRPV
jgi:hypothetical protein